MYSTKLLFGTLLSSISFGFPFLISSSNEINKLNQTYPHWNKLIEVVFYDKEKNKERIKLWIEDLNNLNKSQYWDNNEWKIIENNKKYSYLLELSNYYLLSQHKINLISSFNWLNKDEKDIKFQDFQCSSETKLVCLQEEKDCFNKEKIIENQQIFSAYLTNLYSPWNYSYFQPIQAHIYLGENVNFKNSKEVIPKPKTLRGTTIYGFVDYWYKEKENPNVNNYKKLIKNKKATLENKRYFINYPQTFNLEENNKKINLKKIYTELQKTEFLKDGNKNQNNENCDNLKCLIKRNYIKSLNNLEFPFKDLSNCKEW